MALKIKRKKARYVKQRNNYSCGPIAILNALKWRGYDLTYNFIKKLYVACDTSSDYGTRWESIDDVLNNFSGIKSIRIDHVKIRQIDDHLKNGGSVILHIRPSIDGMGHYFFIEDFVEDKYIGITYNAINFCDTNPNCMMPRVVMTTILKRCMRMAGEPRAWLISKL